MDRGAWRAAVHEITKSRTRLTALITCAYTLSLVPVKHLLLNFFTLHFSSLKSHYLFHCLLVSCLSPFLALSVYNCKYLYVE